MKKSKTVKRVVLVAGLAAVLTAMSVSQPTFSWFNRPQSEKGGSLSLNIPYGDTDPLNNALSMKAYDGKDLTMETFLSTDDAITFSEDASAPATNVTGLEPGKRMYYKTTITNTGDTDQRVSLYLKNFTPAAINGTNVCVGVNKPIKAFKNYSMYEQTIPPATKNRTTNDKKRVYFNAIGRVGNDSKFNEHKATWGASSAKPYYVCSGAANTDIDSNKGSAGIHTAMTVTPNESNVYYADIDANHNKLYFTVKDWNGVNYKRTQTFTNLNGDGLSQVQSLLFYTNGTYTDMNNAWAGKENITGASFASYYNSASLSVGQTLDLSLASGIDYGGQSIAYSSGDTNIFTVTDEGVVTAKGAGTANLTYTVTSSMGDTIQRTAKIVVHSYNVSSTTITNAPVVTNLLVKAHSSEEVWWFIQNGDDEYANSSADAAYTHDGLFLSV